MSDVIVLKFGGTSLATPGRVRLAARRVRAHADLGRRVVVVVSAAGRTTDRILSGLARLGPPSTSEGACREMDRALATGEDRSAALLASALWRLGVPARSLRGGEAGVRVEGTYGGGRIVAVEAAALERLLDAGIVPVVSGFQGERPDGETLTLGRGGSDTSAVAIAAALGAPCHLVTDVEAVFDRDPRLDRSARPFRALDHATLVALAEGGARVVHPAAARVALKAGVPLRVYHFRAPLAGAGTSVNTVAAAAEGGAA